MKIVNWSVKTAPTHDLEKELNTMTEGGYKLVSLKTLEIKGEGPMWVVVSKLVGKKKP